MKFKTVLSIAALLALAAAASAQCSFTPTVTGDSLLCPGDTTVFSTQEYDSYQWFRRVYPDGTPQAINGATQQTLMLADADLLYYYWVEATDIGCTEASAEVLLDGLVFLLPFVSHEGDFVFDPNTESFKICEGDTMFLVFSYPANITWFRNGVAIPGQTMPKLAVTEPGAYTVQGAPGICPNYVQPLGLVLDVVVVSCSTPVEPSPVPAPLLVYPNPASDWLTVENKAAEPLLRMELINVMGQTVRLYQAGGDAVQRLSLEDLPAGIYWLRVQRTGETTMLKISKR